MPINIQGHGIELTPYLRDYAIKKLQKLNEFFDGLQKIEVVLDARKIKDSRRAQVADVSIWASGKKVIHAAESGEDMYASIDLVYEELKKQVQKHKDKHVKETRREGRRLKDLIKHAELNYIEETAAEPVVVKSKRFYIRNMTVEEAAAEQEMRGHDFFMFRDVNSGETKVLHNGQVLDQSTLKTLNENEASQIAKLASANFLAFINSTSKDLNVIYKRRTGNFGLIQPAE